jgi:hypothetical protein
VRSESSLIVSVSFSIGFAASSFLGGAEHDMMINKTKAKTDVYLID